MDGGWRGRVSDEDEMCKPTAAFRAICGCAGHAVDLSFARRPGESPMLFVMQSHATEEQVRAVCQRIEALGLKAHPIPGSIRPAIGIKGNKGAVDLGALDSLPGV